MSNKPASAALSARLEAEATPEGRLVAWPRAMQALLTERPALGPLLLGERLRARGGAGKPLPAPGQALLAATVAAGRQAGRLQTVEPAALQDLLQ